MKNDDLGKLILRLTVGGLMLFHGIAKISSGTAMIGTLLEEKGLPAFLQYGVYLGEIVAPALIVVGFLVRPAAWVLVVNMLFAIALQHSGDIFKLADPGGAWAIEGAAYYLFGGIAIACLGAGKYTLVKTGGGKGGGE